jgi:hypothetical protein
MLNYYKTDKKLKNMRHYTDWAQKIFWFFHAELQLTVILILTVSDLNSNSKNT